MGRDGEEGEGDNNLHISGLEAAGELNAGVSGLS